MAFMNIFESIKLKELKTENEILKESYKTICKEFDLLQKRYEISEQENKRLKQLLKEKG